MQWIMSIARHINRVSQGQHEAGYEFLAALVKVLSSTRQKVKV